MKRFVVVALALFAFAGEARAQAFAGAPLQPIVQARGPFKQVVVGASVVRSDGTVAPNGSGVVDVADGSTPALGMLFWWGSGTAADTTVTLRLPNDATVAINANANQDCGVIAVNLGGETVNYFQCVIDVTADLLQLGSLDGAYTIEGLTPSVAAPHFVPNDQCGTGTQACSIYVGAFALAMFYVDPADPSPRVVQLANGLLFTQFIGDDAMLSVDAQGNLTPAPLLPFEMSNNGGSATIVALEGDIEFPGAACNGTINDLDGQQRPECDFFAMCRGTCASNRQILQLTQTDIFGPDNVAGNADDRGILITNAANPAGNTFNETVTSEFGNEITGVDGDERNSLDIDTFNLQGRLPNGVYNDLVAAVQTGGDAALLAIVAVSIEDFDRDGDGLSNIQETDDVGTDENNPDTDGDGIFDGPEFFGGLPGDAQNNPTNPLDPDSDNDGLCDGTGTVGICVGGEDLNNDGLRQPDETNPNDLDSDDDLLSDGLEVLTGEYLGCATGCFDNNDVLDGFQTDPLDADSDDDGLVDGAEDIDRDGVFDPQDNETDPTNPDTDGGGEADGSERTNGRDPVDFPIDDNGNLGNDNDGDGLANGQEDVDNDGVVDADETDPNDFDTDDDELGDGVEVNGVNDTDPLNPDSDGDGILDGTEDLDHTGTTDPGELSPVDADSDDDGLEDGVEDENQNGTVDGGETDGTNPDSDGDDLCDGDRDVGDLCIAGEDVDLDGTVGGNETDPLDADSDDDGLLDGVEVQSDYEGPIDNDDARPGSQTDPLDSDSDDDGIPDGTEDSDLDGSFDPSNGETDPTDPLNGEEPAGEGEGEDGDLNGGEGGDLDIDEPAPEIETFIAGSAAWACSSASGGAGWITAVLGVLLFALRLRRRR